MEKAKWPRIGKVEFDNPFFLAPLAGVTGSSFRQLCKEQGAALVYSEMVSAKGLYYDGRRTEELLCFSQKEVPIAYQLFGSDPDIMAWAVKKLARADNCMIDINMGCPVAKVTKNGEGAALMQNPILAAKIVESMVEAERQVAKELGRAPKPISVKCRLGWDDNNINYKEFALRMEDAGASALTLHARTREQMYSGKADWEAIANLKSRLIIPLIGNGDIYSGDDARRMLDETACDFLMIGRGALGNPWIFKDAIDGENRLISIEEKIQMIKNHMDLLILEKGERRGLQEMRKHIGWYLKGMEGIAQLRSRINKVSTVGDIHGILRGLGPQSG